MKSLSEKDFKRINISKNYETLTTKKDYLKKQQRLKNISIITIFVFSLIIFIIQIIRISKIISTNENLKSKNELLNKYIIKQELIPKIYSPKIIPYKSKNHIDSIIDHIFYPYKSNIITSMEDVDFLRETLGKVGMRMVYKATMHGDNVAKFQEKTKINNHNLVLIKTKKGNRFGGYTSLNFEPIQMAGFFADAEKLDQSAFLLNLDDKKIYNVKEHLSAVYCDYFFVLHFGENDLVVWNDFLSKGGMSDFPENYGEGAERGDLTREGRKFEVEELEVYHISFYEHDFSDDFDIKHRYGKQ